MDFFYHTLGYFIAFGIPILAITLLLRLCHINVAYFLIPLGWVGVILLFIYHPYVAILVATMIIIAMFYMQNSIKTTIADPIKEKDYKDLFEQCKKRENRN